MYDFILFCWLFLISLMLSMYDIFLILNFFQPQVWYVCSIHANNAFCLLWQSLHRTISYICPCKRENMISEKFHQPIAFHQDMHHHYISILHKHPYSPYFSGNTSWLSQLPSMTFLTARESIWFISVIFFLVHYFRPVYFCNLLFLFICFLVYFYSFLFVILFQSIYLY